MLPLPLGTRCLTPQSIPTLLAIRQEHPGSILVAGGTDVLYNAKYGLYGEAPTFVSLEEIRGFRGTTDDPRQPFISIGALTTLAEVEWWLTDRLPLLAKSAGLVGAPQHRSAGTIGGNIALDTRCDWYNKDSLWRAALGGCLKKDGNTCHVTGSQTACVAARSGDTVGPLLLYGASLEIHTHKGIRDVRLADALTSSGFFPGHLALPSETFIRNIRVPRPVRGFRGAFVKVSPRLAISFSTMTLSIGAWFQSTVCERVNIVISSVRPQPRVLELPVGREMTEEVACEIAAKVGRATKPMTNVHGDLSFQTWRATKAEVEVRRALMDLARKN
ncbi:FAD binding domain-containing protein [Candidatus Uhrbacteria bacterium]|nr:FAD binding domain-containing protein [Candidatus Uhrbacteria bacterium]